MKFIYMKFIQIYLRAWRYQNACTFIPDPQSIADRARKKKALICSRTVQVMKDSFCVCTTYSTAIKS